MKRVVLSAVLIVACGAGASPADAALAKADRVKVCKRFEDPTPGSITARAVSCKTANVVGRLVMRQAQRGLTDAVVRWQGRRWRCEIRGMRGMACERRSGVVRVRFS